MDEKLNRNEALWYLLAMVLACCLRFIGLGFLPLSNWEAANALQALAVSRGAATVIGGQPGYVALTSLLFSVFSPSGFWTLFWPAVFGSVMVFIPLLYKQILGRNVSILLAFLIAIEPGLVAVSRTASGTIIVYASLLAAIGFFLRRRSIWAGLSLGLAILGGQSFWPLCLLTIVICVIYGLSARNTGGEEQKTNTTFWNGIQWQKFLIAMAAGIVIPGTDFFLHPLILSGIGSGFYDYFTSFAKGGGTPITGMTIGFLLSEVLIIPLAVWAMIVGLRKRDRIIEVLGYFLALSLILVLINPGRQFQDWALIELPLLCLAAYGLVDIISRFVRNEAVVTAVQAAATIALCVFSFLNLLSMVVNPPIDATGTRNAVLEVILPLVFLILVTMLLAWGWSMNGARQGLLLGLGFLLLFITFGTSWKAAGLGPRPEAELWKTDGVPVGQKLLLKSVDDLSLWTTGQKGGIDIVIDDVDDSSLLWSLRDYAQLTSTDIVAGTDTPSLLISASETTPGLAASYRGQSILWNSEVDSSKMSPSFWIKWFAFRVAPQKNESIILWARNDLFKGSNN